MRFVPLSILVLLLSAAPQLSDARDLRWDELSVNAQLDSNGDLHVLEKQVMVFTGDWNGGERGFNLRKGQSLTFEGISLVNPQGKEIPLQRGSLSAVDSYDLINDRLVRWRSRAPSDPLFDNTKLTYVLRYTIQGVVQRDENRFLLDHNFVFPDRPGSIEQLSVDLTLDPVWQPVGSMQKRWTGGPLAPGKNFTVNIPLQYRGAGTPATSARISPLPVYGMIASLLLLPPLLLALALAGEKRNGRLDPLETDQVDRRWLEANLFKTPAEVVGAVWDENLGEAEVSALLARLVGEGKLRSQVKEEEMQLTLLVPRDQFHGYERALIDGLFFEGDSTSTTGIRSHYSGKDFNPTKLITPGLSAVVEEQLPADEKRFRPSSLALWILFLSGMAALWAAKNHVDVGNAPLIAGIGSLVGSIFTIAGPARWRTRKDLGISHALRAMIPSLVVVLAVIYQLSRVMTVDKPWFPIEMQLGASMLALWMFATAVSSLRSRESRMRIAHRRMLTTAREYFRRELEKDRPSLDDAWYPYLLAFGLSREMDLWSETFSAAPSTGSILDRSSTTRSSSSSSSSGPTPSFSGGGAAFGGAGSSGSWAGAASMMAAGVATSSSGGSGGSSSSSGSSGGGSGGGW
ncbi:MAG TPA: DUF2207 domain-containing protein [Thermoanaerobaculia bacterium]|nr:DUF2207 domain-containing protein [Thermoanaerobaculia bacterium]